MSTFFRFSGLAVVILSLGGEQVSAYLSVKPTQVASPITTTTKKTVLSNPSLVLTWETTLEKQIREYLDSCPLRDDYDECTPYMIGVVGIPGSGKSTSAEIMAELLGDVGACIFPADGYHYSRAELMDTFPNPLDALYRRGAPDTFNAPSFVRHLEEIRYGKSDNVLLPGFDHAVGDPVADQHSFVRKENRVVICEGLYLLQDSHGWEKVNELFDFTVFVQADVDKCMDRLKIRNRVIPGYTPEEIDVRVDEVDRVNALMAEKSRVRADLVVRSVLA